MRTRKRWLKITWVELVSIILFLVLAALVILPGITPAYEAQRRAACQNNLRQLGSALLMYAHEDAAGRLPRMHGYEIYGAASNAPGCLNVHDDFDFGPDTTALYPQYLGDPLVFVCPSGPHGKRPSLFLGRITIGSNGYMEGAVDATGLVRDDGSGQCAHTGRITNGDVSYTYLPWVVGHDTPGYYDNPVIDEQLAAEHGLPLSGPAQLVALAIRLRQAQAQDLIASMQLLEEDIDLGEGLGMLGDPFVRGGCDTGRERQTVLRRTSDHVEQELFNPPVSYFGRNLISQSVIPVLFDHVTNAPAGSSHFPRGGNILYLDGHVRFVKFPAHFPQSESWVTVMNAAKAGQTH